MSFFFSGEKRPGSEVNTHSHVVGFSRDSCTFYLLTITTDSQSVYTVLRSLLRTLIKSVVKWNNNVLENLSVICKHLLTYSMEQGPS